MQDVVARAARALAVAHVHPELGREHDLVAAPWRTSPRNSSLTPAAVDVGGVEERDALRDRGVDTARVPAEVDAASEVVAAEADDGDLEAGVAERAGRELVSSVSR